MKDWFLTIRQRQTEGGYTWCNNEVQHESTRSNRTSDLA